MVGNTHRDIHKFRVLDFGIKQVWTLITLKTKCSVNDVAEDGWTKALVHFNPSVVQTNDPVGKAHNMLHLQTSNSAFCWRAKQECDVRYAEIAMGLYNDRVEGSPNLTRTSAEVELDHPYSPTVQHHLVDGPFMHPAGVCSWSNIR